MTAPAPETAVDLAALPPSMVVPGIAGWLGRANYQTSLDAGLTESFEEFCDRISQQPGDVHTEIRQLQAREMELEARIAAATAVNQRLREGQ
jgi:predicted component of type VI protein secretion system